MGLGFLISWVGLTLMLAVARFAPTVDLPLFGAVVMIVGTVIMLWEQRRP